MTRLHFSSRTTSLRSAVPPFSSNLDMILIRVVGCLMPS
jgi:hypothetical protein